MATINLRDFYPFYTHDELIKVSDAVASKLIAGKKYNCDLISAGREH